MPSPHPSKPEVLGSRVTHVVRLGDTVRRPVRPFTATVQAYLRHLHAAGFTDAPVPLGVDDEGREVLTYVEGDVPDEPLPAWSVTEDALVALAVLIGRLHTAAEGWQPPPDAVFGAIPGTPSGIVPLFATPELVSHQDYCSGNVVYRRGLPAALIDFDLARPTTRIADLANASYYWVPLTDPVDRTPALAGLDSAARLRIFADAYGLAEAQHRELGPTAVQRSANAIRAMRAAADVHPVFRGWWDGGVKDRMPRTLAWVTAEDPRLEAALLA